MFRVREEALRLEMPKRKRIRLKGYDYSSSGAYFITICVKDRQNLLWEYVGAIINRPQLSKHGIAVENTINATHSYYPQVTVNKYVIMPNHIHMILFLNNEAGKRIGGINEENGRLIIAPTTKTTNTAPNPTISIIVQQMKRHVSKQIGILFWQKSYHDHIIRNEQEYLKIWQYVDENPIKWVEDCYYSK